MMKKLALSLVALVALPVLAQTCFLLSQQTNGSTKTCVYQCGGGQRTVIVPAYQMCPSQ